MTGRFGKAKASSLHSSGATDGYGTRALIFLSCYAPSLHCNIWHTLIWSQYCIYFLPNLARLPNFLLRHRVRLTHSDT